MQKTAVAPGRILGVHRQSMKSQLTSIASRLLNVETRHKKVPIFALLSDIRWPVLIPVCGAPVLQDKLNMPKSASV